MSNLVLLLNHKPWLRSNEVIRNKHGDYFTKTSCYFLQFIGHYSCGYDFFRKFVFWIINWSIQLLFSGIFFFRLIRLVSTSLTQQSVSQISDSWRTLLRTCCKELSIRYDRICVYVLFTNSTTCKKPFSFFWRSCEVCRKIFNVTTNSNVLLLCTSAVVSRERKETMKSFARGRVSCLLLWTHLLGGAVYYLTIIDGCAVFWCRKNSEL